MIIINNSSVADVKYGSRQADKVYHGSNLVWERDYWDGEYVYLRAGSAPGYAGDILLGGSGGLLYDTGSSNPNYNGLTSITKYGFTISTGATQMDSNYSLLNLFDGINDMGHYAVVNNGSSSTKQINFYIHMPFNQWELTQFGYWEGTFSDTTNFVNRIYIVPPNRSDYVPQWSGTATENTLHCFPCSYLFNNGESIKNRFILGLVTATEKYWHYYTEIIFELRIPYTEYKAWKRQYHVPVKIAEKTINNKTIGSIVMK